jgi:biotin carboxyl carrier protein
MKMEHSIVSPKHGTVSSVTAAVGSLVSQGDRLFTVT